MASHGLRLPTATVISSLLPSLLLFAAPYVISGICTELQLQHVWDCRASTCGNNRFQASSHVHDTFQTESDVLQKML